MKVAWDPNLQISSRAERLKQTPEKMSSSQKSLQEAADQFESLFLHQLLTEMRKTVSDGGNVFGDRKGEKIFQSMLDEEMSTVMSKAGGIGLGRLLYDQLVNGVPDND